MSLEIERKWILQNDQMSLHPETPYFRQAATHIFSISQKYLISQKKTSLRVRITRNDTTYTQHAYVTVKGPSNLPNAVQEYEMPISLQCADDLMASTLHQPLTKTRYVIPIGGEYNAEVDVFSGVLYAGLVVAEIEFKDAIEAMEFVPPAWFGPEVTNDSAYKNVVMWKRINDIVDL